ncbi:MAG: hypothetical protein IPK80_12030 [Nannocystis sp.]|nr:hypothetical protein [Nannocystis sp.]
MPSHFSTIGFEIDSVDEMIALAERASTDAEVIAVDGDRRYVVWSAGDGPELWLQLDEEGGLIGMAPHFAGRHRWRIGLIDEVARPNHTELDGAFYVWRCPDGEDPEDGLYPFVFDCPDRAIYGELDMPTFASVQLAGFAHAVEVWPDIEAYDASKGEGSEEQPRLASMSFIPAGLFAGEDSEADTPPEAYAIITGVVRSAARRKNPLSGARYQWAELITFGGILDVVIDAGLLGDRELRTGNVVSGAFWLSGQLDTEDAVEPAKMLD